MSKDYLDDELQYMDELEHESADSLESAIKLSDPISALKLQEKVAVSPKTSIADAVNLMKTKHVGCLLVEVDEKLVGIFTERDIVRKVVGKGLNHDKATIADFMSTSIESLHFDDPIVFALNRMSEGGFRHVPIVNAANHALGFVSMRDVVDYIADFYHDQIVNLPPEPVRAAQSSPEGA
jgi:CBS domain-containing protein